MRKLKVNTIEKAMLASMLLLSLMLAILPDITLANRHQEIGSKKHKDVQLEDFLDLTKYSRPGQETRGENQTASGTIEVGGGSGTRTPELPLKITLLSMDKNSYTLGDEAIFDVTLENIGQATIAIPWSPDSSIGSPFQDDSPPNNRLAVISLIVGTNPSNQQRAAAYGLYGSEIVQGSLKKLQPGHKVRIRVPFHWQFFDAEAARELVKRSAQRFPVRAEIFLRGKRISYLPATSANSLTVELKRE